MTDQPGCPESGRRTLSSVRLRSNPYSTFTYIMTYHKGRREGRERRGVGGSKQRTGHFSPWKTAGMKTENTFLIQTQPGDSPALGRLAALFPTYLRCGVCCSGPGFCASVGRKKKKKTGSSFASRQPAARALEAALGFLSWTGVSRRTVDPMEWPGQQERP
ncbi:hypothetical protein VTG60DRAFT_971 [Thermothelomyces hinnuleus]